MKRRPGRQRYEPGESSQRRQVAAFPWRAAKDGAVEVMLVTSRETGRWLLPKGHRMVGLSPHAAAAQEAEEEAGVRGTVSPVSMGEFRYLKRDPGNERWVDVDVFALQVRRELNRWKEKHERKRAWFVVSDAADAVIDPDLARFLCQAESWLTG
ncbi:MAG TPA: NUDIX hydrolase [Sphingomicrobium sp.]|jgi:8-oxo-dGTP pyrophosphatase MutT (NUDIX family)|nr:NUDIX hydrolase [Sphingomicrobium sp.]